MSIPRFIKENDKKNNQEIIEIDDEEENWEFKKESKSDEALQKVLNIIRLEKEFGDSSTDELKEMYKQIQIRIRLIIVTITRLRISINAKMLLNSTEK